MLRALGFRSGDSSEDTSPLSQQQKIETALRQAHDFEVCLTAMDYVLDDRASEGLALIEHQHDAIYRLATGVVHFIEFTLGFEQETRELAQRTLAEAEALSAKAKAHNERNKVATSSMYPPGTEFAVTLAESTLLNALCMLLSESMLESAKALYKLRRAYHILDELSTEIERRSGKNVRGSSFASANVSTATLSSSASSGAAAVNMFADVPVELTDQQKRDAKIIRHCEKLLNMRRSRFDGSNIGNDAAATRLRSDLGAEPAGRATVSTLNDVNTSTIDEFIHSGVHLCFGILQVVLSLIPPAVGRVLSIVGFKGSREAGLKMLWSASELRNIHGSLALLALLVFYDGPFQFTDTDFDVPSALDGADEQQQHDLLVQRTLSRQSSRLALKKTLSSKKMEMERKALVGIGEPTLLHPGKRLETALLNARATFPNSALWLSQEGRMLASQGRTQEAADLMDTFVAGSSQMGQVEALLVFDRAMIFAFLHRYERSAADFLHLHKINAWNKSLYYYCAGACYLESWRMCQSGLYSESGTTDVDPERADWYLEQATKYLLAAPDQIESKKKPMPFDKFLTRKLDALKRNGKNLKLSLADSVGTSLIHEICYFWNGYNRMSAEDLRLSFKLLSYNDPQAPTELYLSKLPSETDDQRWIRYTLQAICLRRLGQMLEGQELIDRVVDKIVTPEGKIHKYHDDPWLYPTALYEKALFVWKIQGVAGLDEVKRWLDKAIGYAGGDYELSTRISMKIKAAIDRLEGL